MVLDISIWNFKSKITFGKISKTRWWDLKREAMVYPKIKYFKLKIGQYKKIVMLYGKKCLI